MKHIKLLIYSKEKLDKVVGIFKKYGIKIQNNFYILDDKKFKIIKDEINNLDIGVSILRDPGYVIIKEKMKRISPVKYVTYKEFNEFKTSITNKVDTLDTKVNVLDAKVSGLGAKVNGVDAKIGTLATTAYVDKKFNEANNNTLELFKIGLTPLYKKLKIKLPEQFK